MRSRQRRAGAQRTASAAAIVAATVAALAALSGCAGASASAGESTTTTVHRTTTMTASTTATAAHTVIQTVTATHTTRSTTTTTMTPASAHIAPRDRPGEPDIIETTGTATRTPSSPAGAIDKTRTQASSPTSRAASSASAARTPPAITATTPRTTPRASSTASSPAAPHFGIPVKLGNARQVITVAASSPSATRAVLKAWQQGDDGRWRVVIGPITAHVGSAGIGTASETTAHTPQGTFTLTQAFGSRADPGSGLPYRQTDNNDWWVSDVQSPDYNTWQSCAKASCPFNTHVSEHLRGIWQYAYAIVMDYNRSPAVPGAGSAFFLHVTDGHATAGCVSIAQRELVKVLRWLDPADHPRIATGIG